LPLERASLTIKPMQRKAKLMGRKEGRKEGRAGLGPGDII